MRYATVCRLICLAVGLLIPVLLSAHEGHEHPSVIDHDEVKIFENNGNELRGIATLGTGAKEFEVWRSSVAPGSSTPKHTHESEEVFVFLKGKGRAVIGDEELEFEAPCTLVAPAGVAHQYWNTGDEPTDAIVIIGIGSKIWSEDGKVLELPWRQ